jgi:hypothetical protein
MNIVLVCLGECINIETRASLQIYIQTMYALAARMHSGDRSHADNKSGVAPFETKLLLSEYNIKPK